MSVQYFNLARMPPDTRTDISTALRELLQRLTMGVVEWEFASEGWARLQTISRLGDPPTRSVNIPTPRSVTLNNAPWSCATPQDVQYR
jgi:hypothetical protein